MTPAAVASSEVGEERTIASTAEGGAEPRDGELGIKTDNGRDEEEEEDDKAPSVDADIAEEAEVDEDVPAAVDEETAVPAGLLELASVISIIALGVGVDVDALATPVAVALSLALVLAFVIGAISFARGCVIVAVSDAVAGMSVTFPVELAPGTAVARIGAVPVDIEAVAVAVVVAGVERDGSGAK